MSAEVKKKRKNFLTQFEEKYSKGMKIFTPFALVFLFSEKHLNTDYASVRKLSNAHFTVYNSQQLET